MLRLEKAVLKMMRSNLRVANFSQLVVENMVLVTLNIQPKQTEIGFFLPQIFTAINTAELPIVGLLKAMTLMGHSFGSIRENMINLNR